MQRANNVWMEVLIGLKVLFMSSCDSTQNLSNYISFAQLTHAIGSHVNKRVCHVGSIIMASYKTHNQNTLIKQSTSFMHASRD